MSLPELLVFLALLVLLLFATCSIIWNSWMNNVVGVSVISSTSALLMLFFLNICRMATIKTWDFTMQQPFKRPPSIMPTYATRFHSILSWRQLLLWFITIVLWCTWPKFTIFVLFSFFFFWFHIYELISSYCWWNTSKHLSSYK